MNIDQVRSILYRVWEHGLAVGTFNPDADEFELIRLKDQTAREALVMIVPEDELEEYQQEKIKESCEGFEEDDLASEPSEEDYLASEPIIETLIPVEKFKKLLAKGTTVSIDELRRAGEQDK